MMENLNEKSYDAIVDQWQKIRDDKPVNTCIIQFCHLLKEKGSVLDVGCGSGKPIAQYLSQQGFQVTGIDISAVMLQKAEALHLPNATFQQADFLNFYCEQKFDGLIAFDSIFHLESKLQPEIYPKAASLVKEGGYFLFTAGCKQGDVKGKMFDQEFSYGALDSETIKRLLVENHFKIMKFIEDYQEKTTGQRDLLAVARKI